MTEDQARERWCPFARSRGVQVIVSDDATAFGKWGPADRGISVKCIASDCMAWRSTNWEHRDTMEESRGYCGLAGKP